MTECIYCYGPTTPGTSHTCKPMPIRSTSRARTWLAKADILIQQKPRWHLDKGGYKAEMTISGKLIITVAGASEGKQGGQVELPLDAVEALLAWLNEVYR